MKTINVLRLIFTYKIMHMSSIGSDKKIAEIEVTENADGWRITSQNYENDNVADAFGDGCLSPAVWTLLTARIDDMLAKFLACPARDREKYPCRYNGDFALELYMAGSEEIPEHAGDEPVQPDDVRPEHADMLQPGQTVKITAENRPSIEALVSGLFIEYGYTADVILKALSPMIDGYGQIESEAAEDEAAAGIINGRFQRMAWQIKEMAEEAFVLQQMADLKAIETAE